MLVTITQYLRMARDENGLPMYLGKDRLGCEVRTAAGAFVALNPNTKLIRVATDTAIQMDVAGGATTAADELFPAGSVEYLAVNGGETFTIATVA